MKDKAADPVLGAHGKRSWDVPQREERKRAAHLQEFKPWEPLEPLKTIDVLGKDADEVAQEIVESLGQAASNGCVLVLQARRCAKLALPTPLSGTPRVAQGTRSLGMEPQPDLYVTGAVAVIALIAMDAGNKKPSDEPKRKRR